MLGAAIEAAATQGRAIRVVTPTKKAADVAAQELGVATDSVAKLVHEHGWRWNRDGVWTRLAVGDSDPETGVTYTGPSAAARLTPGERIVVDEAGMLDQDTALAVLTVADEHGATLALVGDRAQLFAVGRGGVLDLAAQLSPRLFDMSSVHRFTDPAYADLSVRMRRGENPELRAVRLLRPVTVGDLRRMAVDRVLAQKARKAARAALFTAGDLRDKGLGLVPSGKAPHDDTSVGDVDGRTFGSVQITAASAGDLVDSCRRPPLS